MKRNLKSIILEQLLGFVMISMGIIVLGLLTTWVESI